MFGQLLTKIVGTQNDRELKRLRPRVADINAFEPAIKALSDEQLRAAVKASGLLGMPAAILGPRPAAGRGNMGRAEQWDQQAEALMNRLRAAK